ncbi:helix-turn-helix transcriptional regulator [Nonomuraea angiospora]|uniref:DNA-binding NarL/FixJ family response regulator n=1 Tax=Nonomuraea angiospora TaxID=46172 RepID=A0ABR9LSZ2_9ACTN|nr:helix-turn-helix transcriptional regulator [Nonomuraea angiospora]MBE1583771.1 DNA-binding NarL/FixJ family response regulator [Nonomuraea angiospora]
MLIGRIKEQAAIDGLLATARAGKSGSLVLRGEAGIGKSALLDYAAEAAGEEMRVLRGAGFEPEIELPFAGLHLLLRGAVDTIDVLPAAQARALRGALGMEPGFSGDRFLVGLALLTLLADLAERRPLLCLVDDAQWLDHASAEALLFAARRLEAEGVVLIFAAREDEHAFPAAGVPDLHLTGLDTSCAAELLATYAGDLAPRARERLLREAHGNPLALLELPALLTAAQSADESPIHAFGIGSCPAPGRVHHAFRDRIARLPEAARTVLLVAAADDTGALDVVLTAARKLGVDLADLDTAEAAGLVHVGDGRVFFRHPLVRSAVYHLTSLMRRLAAHRALAETLAGRPGDVDRWAWHLAAAATGPDEESAAALERSAEHARARGGHAAVAAACERAAQLSPDPRERGRRLTLAAAAAAEAGLYERACELADQAASDVADPKVLAYLARTRAMIAMAHGEVETAHALLTGTAEAIIGQAEDVAIALFFEALTPAWIGSNYAALARTATRVSELHSTKAGQLQPMTRVLAGMGGLAGEEPPGGLAWLRDMIEGLRDRSEPAELQERAQLAIWDLVIGDDTLAHERAVAIERQCRAQGAIGLLPLALALVARSQMFLGMHREALASAEEGLRIARDTEQGYYAALLVGVLTYLAAIEGDEERCLKLAEQIADVHDAATGGMRCVSLNLLDLSLGRPETALRRAEEFGAFGPAARTVMVMHRMPDLVEAAVRADRNDFAVAASERVQVWAAQTPSPWADAVALRCRALLASDEDAERYYEQALHLHLRGGRLFERARTELLYGEWLRRLRRRADARHQLRSALDIFERLGSRPWADRARAELRAAGERQTGEGRLSEGVLDRLTSQELQIIRMAATGLSNREIAAQLFLSPRTIGYHLYKAYPKLGVASRAELARLDLDEGGHLTG